MTATRKSILVLGALLAHGFFLRLGPAGADEAAQALAERFCQARLKTLDAAKIRSLEIRFVESRRGPTKVARIGRLARRQGEQWSDIWEDPLPEGVVQELTSGERIRNAGRAGTQGRVDWQVKSTVYSSMIGRFTLAMARWARKPPDLPDEGQATRILRQMGYYAPTVSFSGKKVDGRPGKNAFAVHNSPDQFTVYAYDPALASLGLATSFEIHLKGGIMQRETFHHWREYGGVWLPTRLVKERYYNPAVSGPVDLRALAPSKEVIRVDTFDILDVRVNEPLRAADLAPTIPDGALLMDERFGTHLQYRYKAGRSDAEFEAVIKQAKAEAAQRARLRGGDGRP